MTDEQAKAALASWHTLAAAVTSADEAGCRRLLALEKKRRGGPRLMILLRVHSRMNYVRAHAERAGLMRLAGRDFEARRADVRARGGARGAIR